MQKSINRRASRKEVRRSLRRRLQGRRAVLTTLAASVVAALAVAGIVPALAADATPTPTSAADSTPAPSAPAVTPPTDAVTPSPTPDAVTPAPTTDAVTPAPTTHAVSPAPTSTPGAFVPRLLAPTAPTASPLATTTAAAALACVPNTFYSISSSGTVYKVVQGGARTDIGGWTNVDNNANGLAIGANGSVMYAIERGGPNAENVDRILRYTPTTGAWESLSNTAYSTGNSTALVAGAVDLKTGRYLFGGYDDTRNGDLIFKLYSFDPTTKSITYVGWFDTGFDAGSVANGDMAFDSAGNLYVVRSGDLVNVYTVTAATLASANGGKLARSATNAMGLPGLSSVNGIAFDGDGSVFLGNGTSAKKFNPTTWASIGATSTLSSSTDLASCNSPANLTVKKNVVARAATGDQFILAVSSGQTQIATATTTGTATGVQGEQIGPIPVIAGTTYTISEGMAAGSAANYASAWSCDNGASGTGTSGSVTIPNTSGASVVCTFTNSPLNASVTVSKTVQDANGGNAQPGAGWTVGAAVAATKGTATSTPAAATQTTSAQGSASWSLRFDATSSRATVTVSEQQKPDYQFVSGSCTITALSGAARTVTLPSAEGAKITDVAPGDKVDCGFINKIKPTSLTLVKKVSFGSVAAGEWTLNAQAPSGALAGPKGTTGTPQTTAIPVSANKPYALSESGGPATYTQVGDWSCVDGAGAAIAVTGGSVSLAAGTQATCTVTNATAKLTLLKHVTDASLKPGDWTITGKPSGALPTVSATGAETASAANTFEIAPNTAYTISEALTGTPGTIAYRQLGIEQLQADGSWKAVTSDQVTVAAGTHATYRFVNDKVPAVVLPLTGGTSTDAYLYGGVMVLLLAGMLAALLLRRNIAVRRA
jgi:LPXTG-motif cell wall-anchored protein